MFLCVMNELIARLSDRLTEPLPGIEAQRKMASSFRFDERFPMPDKAKARLGAVLIPLYYDGSQLSVVLMKRPEYKGAHSGQVSFPGGKHEEQDPDLQHTALREAHEEVGIIPNEVKMIGQLTEMYIPASNFLIQPFIGVMKKPTSLRPDNYEVEEILQPTLTEIFSQNVTEKEIRINSSFSLKAPYFKVGGHTVWGATAMILSELKEVLEESGIRI